MSAPFYRAFEDRYRGSRELIHERQQVYIPFLEPLKHLYAERKAVDVGCGRGEWLEILLSNGFDPLGVDLDAGMLEACHARGLPVEQGDALKVLKRLPDESLTVVSGFHLAEHIPFEVLGQLIRETLRVLKPAGLLILETPNPENLMVGTETFYLDPSHERPIPHLLLSFLTEHCGFQRSKLLRLQEPAGLAAGASLNLMSVLHGVSPDYAIVAQKEAVAQQLQGFDAVFERSYGLSLEMLANRYDSQVAGTQLQLDHLEKVVHELGGRSDLNHADTQAQLHTLELRTGLAEQDVLRSVEERHFEALRINAEIERFNAEIERVNIEFERVNADLQRTHAEIERMGAQNLAHQQQILALLRSSSWRVTQPLRSSMLLTKWTLRLPKRAVRSALARSIRFVLNRPGLRASMSKVIKSRPGLFMRIRQFSLSHGLIQPAPTELAPMMVATEASEDGFGHASPRVAHVYQELKQAFERKENR